MQSGRTVYSVWFLFTSFSGFETVFASLRHSLVVKYSFEKCERRGFFNMGEGAQATILRKSP